MTQWTTQGEFPQKVVLPILASESGYQGIHRQQLFSPFFIFFAQSRRVLQNLQQIAMRMQPIFLCRFNQAVDHSTGPCTTGRIGKRPVLPVHHERLNAVLGTVIAQLQAAILQIPRQIRPLLQQIIKRLGCPQALYLSGFTGFFLTTEALHMQLIFMFCRIFVVQNQPQFLPIIGYFKCCSFPSAVRLYRIATRAKILTIRTEYDIF